METTTEMPQDQSPSLGSLAAALAKAQGEMTAAKKANLLSTPQFKSKYADLASIWEACRAALSKNGLSVIQRVSNHPDGICVRTRLLHASGEWMESSLVVPIAQRTAQSIGSSITYARKYALQATVGVAADDDDDGQAATEAAPNGNAPPPTGKKSAPVSASAKRTSEAREKLGVSEPRQEPLSVGGAPAHSDDEALELIAQEFGITKGRVLLRAKGILGKTSGFTAQDLETLRTAIKAVPPQ